MPALLIGILAGCGASVFFAAGIALQAAEARIAPAERAMSLSLFRRLIARPRWIAGTALGIVGWALQALALVHAPLTLVQPLLGSSLIVLLVIAHVHLGERVGRGEVLAVLAIAAGAPLLALTAPARQTDHAGGAGLWIALGVLGAAALAPYALRTTAGAAGILVPVGAGLAYSWDSLATKFAADNYVTHAWLAVVFWFAAMNVAAGAGTLSEMSALRHRRVAQVAPIIFALTTFVPVALAPLVAREWWPSSPWRTTGLVVALAAVGGGALWLSGSAPLERVAEEPRSESSEIPRNLLEDRSVSAALSDLRP
jgi:Magnesium transporter NIPA